jgi:Protein of unknown function (DUF3606)
LITGPNGEPLEKKIHADESLLDDFDRHRGPERQCPVHSTAEKKSERFAPECDSGLAPHNQIMNEPPNPVTPADADRVNIYDAAELDEYWVGYFEAARQSIIDAVIEVGEKPDDVYKKLGKTHD